MIMWSVQTLKEIWKVESRKWGSIFYMLIYPPTMHWHCTALSCLTQKVSGVPKWLPQHTEHTGQLPPGPTPSWVKRTCWLFRATPCQAKMIFHLLLCCPALHPEPTSNLCWPTVGMCQAWSGTGPMLTAASVPYRTFATVHAGGEPAYLLLDQALILMKGIVQFRLDRFSANCKWLKICAQITLAQNATEINIPALCTFFFCICIAHSNRFWS